MLHLIRKSRFTKVVAASLAVSFLSEIAFPLSALALTSGPSQPEIQGFEPIATNQMVDLFTGDFTYNIPLFELPGPNGGYPFNLAYHSGITMDQEASWVGLGWVLNPGAINRNVRGIPDDFKGDGILTTMDMATDQTIGYGGAMDVQVGLPGMISLKNEIDVKGYYNSLKGPGYSVGLGVGVATSKFGPQAMLTLSSDTQEGSGLGIDLGLNLSNVVNDMRHQYGSIGANLTIHSRDGVSLGISMNPHWEPAVGPFNIGLSLGAKWTFQAKAYMPTLSSETTTNSKSWGAGISLPVLPGIFAGQSTFGFNSIQDLTSKNTPVAASAFGYLYEEFDLTSFNHRKQVYDVNREKDGVIRKETSNLPIPSLTFDVYDVMGQGVGGSYRPYRNQIGHVREPYTRSEMHSKAMDLSLDIVNFMRFSLSNGDGFDLTNDWFTNNDGSNNNAYASFFKYSSGDLVVPQEPVVMKAMGDISAEPASVMESYIGGEKTLYLKADKDGNIVSDAGNYKFFYPGSYKYLNQKNRPNKLVRSQPMVTLTNREIQSIDAFDVNFYGIISYNQKIAADQKLGAPGYEYQRATSSRLLHHLGTLITTSTNGMRYVYGLPVYNLKSKEVMYTVNRGEGADKFDYLTNGTLSLDANSKYQGYKSVSTYYGFPIYWDNFLEVTETPPYASSYMLTSVQGADYVDMTNNGPTQDDLGYWVKFNYVQATDNYQWRAPYSKSNYLAGLYSYISDDKAAYAYGKKEIWYLGSVETSTHIAEFRMDTRSDGRGVSTEFQTDDSPKGEVQYWLKEIRVYSKNEYAKDNPRPIKVVHFDGDYHLCRNVKNTVNTTQTGKYTLNRVWFTYENNTRGASNAYVFTYNEDCNINYNMDQNMYDRWGYYQNQKNADGSHNKIAAGLFPYVKQFDAFPATHQDAATKAAFKTEKDLNAAAWTLSSIKLPSGAIINLQYEADDYAYVQNYQATQMFEIDRLGCSGDGSIVYNNTSWALQPASDETNRQSLKVYFKLETPIPETNPNAHEIVYRDYLKELKVINEAQGGYDYQLYFKIFSNIQKDQDNDELSLREPVSGYATLDIKENSTDLGLRYGVDLTKKEMIDGVNCYTTGFFCLKPYIQYHPKAQTADKHFQYHPFAVSAWQYVRTTKPNLLVPKTKQKDFAGLTYDGDDKAIKDNLNSLGTILGQVIALYVEYTTISFIHGWANTIDLSKSRIKLCSPDKKKFGGGLRVKQVTVDDAWNSSESTEANATYGQKYTYTTTEKVSEGSGSITRTISSGVASYEPAMGNDENAMRHARMYYQNIPLQTPNRLFFEYPTNESYFPAPVVGYSRVEVSSLTDAQTYSGKSTGKSVYEFYTAKDFPVITDAITQNVNEKKPSPLQTDFFKKITSALVFTNGYSIRLNDMHGKLKSESSLSEKGEEISRVDYYYRQKNYVKDGITYGGIYDLDNTLPQNMVLTAEGQMASATQNLGVDYEFFMDFRAFQTYFASISAGVSVDPAAWFLPQNFPKVSILDNHYKMAVTNKIISKKGILIKTVAKNLGVVRTVENKMFDAITGMPVLVTETNEYNDVFYKYSVPAHMIYEGMGQASDNLGCSFYSSLENLGSNRYALYPCPSGVENIIYPGDELIVDWTCLIRYLGTETDGSTKKHIFYTTGTVPYSSNTVYLHNFRIVRSGKRNMLEANAGTVVSLNNNPVTTRGTELFNNKLIPVVQQSGSDAAYGDYTSTQTLPVLPANSVLSFDVVSFRDFSLKSGLTTSTDPYQRGDKGIWQPWKAYTYYGTRKNESKTTAGQLQTDGVIEQAVPFFNWLDPNFSDVCSSWKMTNAITQFDNNSNEVENKDILNRYRSALYGYNARMTTAVAANARRNEIATEDFENYSSSFNYTGEGNFDFTSNSASLPGSKTDYFDIITGYGDNLAIDRPYYVYSNDYSVSGLNLKVVPVYTGAFGKNVYSVDATNIRRISLSLIHI